MPLPHRPRDYVAPDLSPDDQRLTMLMMQGASQCPVAIAGKRIGSEVLAGRSISRLCLGRIGRLGNLRSRLSRWGQGPGIIGRLQRSGVEFAGRRVVFQVLCRNAEPRLLSE